MIQALKNLKKNIGIFLLFELMFRILFIFLFTEGGGNIVDFLLRFQGYSYVTQGNYFRFLTNPASVIGLCAAALLLLLLILFESCGLFLLFDAGNKEMKISLPLLLHLSAIQTVSFIRRHPLKWILYLVACLPNLYLHLLVWEAGRIRFLSLMAGDICEKIGTPVFVVLLSVFLAVYLFCAMFFSLALPFRIFDKESPYRFSFIAFSVKKGKQFRSMMKSISLHIRVFLATAVIFILSVSICVVCIRIFRPVYRYVSDALVYGSILKLLLGLLIGFFGTVTITGYLYSSFIESQDSCICWEETKPVKRPRLETFTAVLFTVVIVICEASTFIPDTSEAQDYLEISAHRGGAKFAPENTLAAIQYAIDTKADYAEIDVQETKDGEIVLLHDYWLARTTGCQKFVWNTTYAKIQTLDAGSFFSKAYKGEKIPTLREAIEACQGKIRLNIEIKENGHNQDIVQKVLDILQEENFVSNCIVTSMDYSVLKEIKELCPEVVTGYTLSMVYGRVEDMEAADIYSVKYTFVSKNLVDRIHRMGKQICAWTTNTRGPIRKMIDAGVDNVITDDPELVRKELMREYKVTPGFISLVKYMLL